MSNIVGYDSGGADEFEMRVRSIIEKVRQETISRRPGDRFLTPQYLENLPQQLRQDAILLGYLTPDSPVP